MSTHGSMSQHILVPEQPSEQGCLFSQPSSSGKGLHSEHIVLVPLQPSLASSVPYTQSLSLGSGIQQLLYLTVLPDKQLNAFSAGP